MRVGILGGTRFIGWHVAAAFLRRGDAVSVFHRGRTREPAPFPGPVTRVLGDRDRPETLAPFFREAFDVLVDLSGYAPKQVGDALEAGRGRVGHYVFCGTALGRESGAYGADKAAAEDLLLAAGLPVTILRPQGVFGPHGAEQALYVWRRVLAGEPVLLRPESAGKRTNLLWVGDLADAFARVAGNAAAHGRAYAVAGDEAGDPVDFVCRAAAVSGGTFRARTLEERLAARLPHLGLPWHPGDLVADASALRAATGWSPTPLDAALRKTWDWAQAEPGLLDYRPQRWERAAARGELPSAWREAAWRLWDRVRGL